MLYLVFMNFAGSFCWPKYDCRWLSAFEPTDVKFDGNESEYYCFDEDYLRAPGLYLWGKNLGFPPVCGPNLPLVPGA